MMSILKPATDICEATKCQIYSLLEVFLIHHEETVTLKIRDDGKGLPDNFEESDNKSSLGMELIQTLTKQLNGTYSYRSLESGVEFELVFNKSDRKGVGFNFKVSPDVQS